MILKSRPNLSRIFILLIFPLCIISFFGCGGDSDSDDSADNDENPPTEISDTNGDIHETEDLDMTESREPDENNADGDAREPNVPFQPTPEEPLAPPAQPAVGSEDAPMGELSLVASVSGLEAPVTLQDGITVPVGNSMAVQCTVVNNTDETRMISFVTGQKLDVIITDPDGEEVFVWSRGRRFMQVVSAITLDQGGSWSHELTVPIGDGENELPHGTWNMRVVVTGTPELRVTAYDIVIFH